MSNKTIDMEKYQGPGRVASALGDSSLYQIGGGIVGAVAGGAVGHMVIKEEGAIASQVTGALLERGMRLKGKIPLVAGVAIGSGLVVGAISSVVGLFVGWNKAAKGKAQFEAVKDQRDQAVAQTTLLSTQNEALQSEAKLHRKQFTDSIQSKSGEGFAAGVKASADEAQEIAR